MELPIIIEHPTKVSTMVISVRGYEIKLCVCRGNGSERTLFVFKVKYREGDHFEHQLLTVVEAAFMNNYYELGKMKVSILAVKNKLWICDKLNLFTWTSFEYSLFVVFGGITSKFLTWYSNQILVYLFVWYCGCAAVQWGIRAEIYTRWTTTYSSRLFQVTWLQICSI